MMFTRTLTDPGPTTELVRRFSDQQIAYQPRSNLAKGLHSKVTLDRNRQAQLSNDALQKWEPILSDPASKPVE